jgi:hypothetical protein
MRLVLLKAMAHHVPGIMYVAK